MDNYQIFFSMLITSGICIISYKNFALQRGWPIGSAFANEGGVIPIIGILTILMGFIASFFFIKWYYCFGILVGSWLISGLIASIFGRHTQILSLLMFLGSWVFLLLAKSVL